MNVHDFSSARGRRTGALASTRAAGLPMVQPISMSFGSAALRAPATMPSRRPPPLPARRGDPPQSFRWNPPTIVPEAFVSVAVRPRAQGIGWFGVFVAWLATICIGGAAAAGLPGHTLRVRPGAPAPRSLRAAPALLGAPAIPSAPAVAAALVAPVPSVTTAALPASPVAPPLFRISDLPKAHGKLPPVSAPPRAAHGRPRAGPHSHVAAPPPAEEDDTEAAPVEPAPVRARAAEPPARASEPEVRDEEPETRSAPEPARAIRPPAVRAPAAPPAATFAPGSLEDLIRKEVDKEQKGLRHK